MPVLGGTAPEFFIGGGVIPTPFIGGGTVPATGGGIKPVAAVCVLELGFDSATVGEGL